MMYNLSLIGSWIYLIGISAVLVYFSYMAYELYEHFERLEEQCEREARKSFEKLFELEVLSTRIFLLTNR